VTQKAKKNHQTLEETSSLYK